jgi:hypothetical protein
VDDSRSFALILAAAACLSGRAWAKVSTCGPAGSASCGSGRSRRCLPFTLIHIGQVAIAFAPALFLVLGPVLGATAAPRPPEATTGCQPSRCQLTLAKGDAIRRWGFTWPLASGQR